MTKEKPEKNRKSGKNTSEQEHLYKGDLAEIRRREEKFKRTGKLDLDDFPIRHQTYLRMII